MGRSDNPFKVRQVVSIKRGDGWLTGTIVKVVLARCHINIDGKVFVEDWHNCKRKEKQNDRTDQGHHQSTAKRRLTPQR